MRSNQEVFDLVARHLLEQSEKSLLSKDHLEWVSEKSCAYRGLNGKMCAFGVLIPDEIYNNEMEGKCASVLIKNCEDLKYIDCKLADHLQSIHDLYEISDWRDELEFLASQFYLNCKVLDEYRWDASQQRYVKYKRTAGGIE